MAEKFKFGIAGAGAILGTVLLFAETGGEGDPINLYTQDGAASLGAAVCPVGNHIEFTPVALAPAGDTGNAKGDVLLRGTQPDGAKATFITSPNHLKGHESHMGAARVLGTVVLDSSYGCIVAVNDLEVPRRSIFERIGWDRYRLPRSITLGLRCDILEHKREIV